MAFLAFKQSNLSPVQDQETITSAFNAAVQACENVLADRLDRSPQQETHVRPAFESAFASAVNVLGNLMILPDLHGEKLSRVLTMGLVDIAYMSSMEKPELVVASLQAMKRATEKSPDKEFYQAAISEIEDEYAGKPWPEPSVAEAEHDTLGALRLIYQARRLLNRAEFLPGSPTIQHPRELQARQQVVTNAVALNEGKAPETLRLLAQGYAVRVGALTV